jgi:Bacteriophage translational regulator
MNDTEVSLYNWTPESLLSIVLSDPDDFLKIKETLTRIGIASKRENTLFQSCHILHKRGKYYCVHFKELFQLDGRPSNISQEDISRRNTIAGLLEQWGLCKVQPVDAAEYKNLQIPLSAIKVVSYRDKKIWNLQSKYAMRCDRQMRSKDTRVQLNG